MFEECLDEWFVSAVVDGRKYAYGCVAECLRVAFVDILLMSWWIFEGYIDRSLRILLMNTLVGV